MACGSVIRLQHLQTRLFLHSHNFRSPLSSNQEVSCFGDGEEGDEGDLLYLVGCMCVMMCVVQVIIGCWSVHRRTGVEMNL